MLILILPLILFIILLLILFFIPFLIPNLSNYISSFGQARDEGRRVEEEEGLIPPHPFSLPGLYGEGGWRGGGRISFITWGWREEGRGRRSYSG